MMIYSLFVNSVGCRVLFSNNLLPLASGVLETSDIDLSFMGYPFIERCILQSI